MRAQEADRAATRVGLVTVLIGAALAVAPQKMSRVLRFGDHARAVQVVGLADMALVPGLFSHNARATGWTPERL